MIFLDTNIVVDLITGENQQHAGWTDATLAERPGGQSLACNLIVVAEVAAGLRQPEVVLDDLATLSIAICDLDAAVALRAAGAFREYRKRGGARSTILPDFLIAAHAATLGAQLMTRDRRLASYFPGLALITPETHP